MVLSQNLVQNHVNFLIYSGNMSNSTLSEIFTKCSNAQDHTSPPESHSMSCNSQIRINMCLQKRSQELVSALNCPLDAM